MVAADFLQDPRVQGWLDEVEPAWTLLTFESLRALRHEPSAVQTAIRIANDLSVGEIAGSPVARNTLILLRQAIERVGLPLTATGNLSRAAVAEMCKLIEWLIMDGLLPAHVPDAVISEIRSRERGGFVELPKSRGLAPGMRVRVISGPLHDQIGLLGALRPHERVLVLLQLLGWQQRVDLASNAIEAI